MDTRKTKINSITGTSRIPNPHDDDERYGRKILSAVVWPLTALLVIILMMIFGSPAAVITSFIPDRGYLGPQQRMAFKDLETAVAEAERAAEPNGNSFTSKALEGGCFNDMGYAANDKLERCQQLVYLALSKIQLSQEGRIEPSRVASAIYPDLIPNLRLAAVEACRESWARDLDSGLQGPTCSLAELTLARSD